LSKAFVIYVVAFDPIGI
jgi:hypothetical protein